MIDLHLHTTASDGHCDPPTLVRRAWEAGLRTIAVADHDTVAAVAPVASLAREYRMRLVTGIEITAVHQERDVHVLGYFVDAASPALAAILTRQRADRVSRVREMARLLERQGKTIDVERLLAPLASQPEWAIGRPVVARALVEAGHVQDVATAFETLIGTGGPAYVPRTGLTPPEVFRLVHAAGGVASLAHPGPAGCDDEVAAWADAGLDALEAYHPDHSDEDVARYARLAAELGLAISGGSDYHGDRRHSRLALGAVTLPPVEFERLEARVGGRRG